MAKKSSVSNKNYIGNTGISTGGTFGNINIVSGVTNKGVTYHPDSNYRNIIYNNTDQVFFEEDTCSKCGNVDRIAVKYNHSLEQKLTRKICTTCHTKAMDKFYDLNRSIETEEILFEKE